MPIQNFVFILLFLIGSCSKIYYIPHYHPHPEINAKIEELKGKVPSKEFPEKQISFFISLYEKMNTDIIQSQYELIDCLVSAKDFKFLLEGRVRPKDFLKEVKEIYDGKNVEYIKFLVRDGRLIINPPHETAFTLLNYAKLIDAYNEDSFFEPKSNKNEDREQNAVRSAKEISRWEDVIIVFGTNHQAGFKKLNVEIFNKTPECKKYVSDLHDRLKKFHELSRSFGRN